MSSDPWGRVDETGTVYVRTADGEQVVGSWQAGSPEEALAHFERKYEGLVVEIGLLERRVKTTDLSAKDALATMDVPEAEASSQYLIPLAFRKRALFKMDLAEALYISELRTTPAGHWSYRKVAHDMYEAVAKRHPALARYFRVTDIHEPVDLLKR